MTAERNVGTGRLDGPGGEFEVVCVGTRAEAEYCFLYQDGSSRFYFHAELSAQPTSRFKITRASMGEWFGPPFNAFGTHEDVLKQNIELFFRTRDWLHPWKSGSETPAAIAVAFEWNIAQIDGRVIRPVQIVGPSGPFEIAIVRMDRDGARYFYQDQRGRFIFYAERASGLESEWDILSDGRFRTSRENEAILRQNIEYFFKTHSSADPKRRLYQSPKHCSITFLWKTGDLTQQTKPSEILEARSGHIEGRSGPFEISFAGSNPQGWHCYNYRDGRNSFWFMALLSFRPAPTWDVARAALAPWRERGSYKINSEDEAILRENIVCFFRTRQWHSPSDLGNRGIEATPVRFSWEIVS